MNTDVDDFWEGVRQLGEQIAGARAESRRQKRDARNARRRAAYRSKPRAPRRTAATMATDDEEPPTSCCCQAVSVPPRSWCEGGGNDEGEA